MENTIPAPQLVVYGHEYCGLSIRLHQELDKAYNELRQTQQAVMQQECLKALGQMASGIAHDINNVLGLILLSGSSLERRLPSGDPSKQEAADIVAAVLHGKQLTQDLLNFAHRGPRHAEVCRPGEVIARLVDLYSMRCQ